MIATIIIIILLILYFDKVNKCIKLQKKLESKSIPFDDYSAYIKSYTEYYKWLSKKIKIPGMHDDITLKWCLEIYRDSFKHCENEND